MYMLMHMLLKFSYFWHIQGTVCGGRGCVETCGWHQQSSALFLFYLFNEVGFLNPRLRHGLFLWSACFWETPVELGVPRLELYRRALKMVEKCPRLVWSAWSFWILHKGWDYRNIAAYPLTIGQPLCPSIVFLPWCDLVSLGLTETCYLPQLNSCSP